MTILCIYHGSCTDGFGAAWAVRRALGDGVEFFAGRYGSAPPDVTGRDVLIVDFSYKHPVLEVMAAVARSIVILDHHKTAEDDLAPFKIETCGGAEFLWSDAPGMLADLAELGRPPIIAHFDMRRSGAGMAWDCFHPGAARPWLIDLIETRDLWREDDMRWQKARLAHAYVNSYPFDFGEWDEHMRISLFEEGRETIIKQGAAILRQHDKDVAEAVSVTRRRMVIAGHDVPVANVPFMMTSDAGNIMARGKPFAACYLDTGDGRIFSLRSTDAGLDVSIIAKTYGGGGHRNAAGFRMPRGWEGDSAA